MTDRVVVVLETVGRFGRQFAGLVTDDGTRYQLTPEEELELQPWLVTKDGVQSGVSLHLAGKRSRIGLDELRRVFGERLAGSSGVAAWVAEYEETVRLKWCGHEYKTTEQAKAWVAENPGHTEEMVEWLMSEVRLGKRVSGPHAVEWLRSRTPDLDPAVGRPEVDLGYDRDGEMVTAESTFAISGHVGSWLPRLMAMDDDPVVRHVGERIIKSCSGLDCVRCRGRWAERAELRAEVEALLPPESLGQGNVMAALALISPVLL